ncbi:MAG TPA: signal peptidase I [Baekduia sp.]|jgi:signal peptidase I
MRHRALDVVAALIALVALALLLPGLVGLHRYVITSGSMGHTIPTGSIVLDRSIPTADIHRGDIITFTAPGRVEPITHRVMTADAHGITTRGDANRATDPWLLPRSTPLRRVSTHVPFAGYGVIALRSTPVRGLLLAILTGGLGLLLLRGVVRDLRHRPGRVVA